MSARPARLVLAERVAELIAGARASDGWPLDLAGEPATGDFCSPFPASATRVAVVRDALLALLAVDAPASPAVLTDEECEAAGLAAFVADTGLSGAAWEDLAPRARVRYRRIAEAAVEHVLRLRGGQ